MMRGRKCGIFMTFKEIQPSNLPENSFLSDEICWLRCQCENEKYVGKGGESSKSEEFTARTRMTRVEVQLVKNRVNFWPILI